MRSFQPKVSRFGKVPGFALAVFVLDQWWDRRLVCQGVVLDRVLASVGMPGFACSYAVTNIDLSRGLRSILGGPPGIRPRRRQRFVVQGSSEGGAHEPLAGGGASPRPQGAS